MAYRVHVQVFDRDDRRLSLRALLSLPVPGGCHVGTRRGTPGVWIEIDPRPRRDGGWPSGPYLIRRVVHVLYMTLLTGGLIGRFYATNSPTYNALLRGRARGLILYRG